MGGNGAGEYRKSGRFVGYPFSPDVDAAISIWLPQQDGEGGTTALK
jgi:hypothetical protein